MASQSFRDSLNSLGWSRRDANLPVNTSRQSGFLSSLESWNPFGDRGYVQLPTTESAGAPLPAPTRREEEEGWFARKPVPPYHTLLAIGHGRLEDRCAWILHTHTFCGPYLADSHTNEVIHCPAPSTGQVAEYT